MAIIENKENEKFKELLKKENLTKEDVMKMSDEQVMEIATRLILQSFMEADNGNTNTTLSFNQA